MYSYQHRYHAGGFADVHKHICLIALLEALQQKPSPFGVMDAYAGEGIYDLHSPEAQKIKEYETGFLPWLFNGAKDPLLQRYVEEIRKVNGDDEVRYYPGSSAIIRSFLREQDHACLLEKHPQALTALRSHFKQNKNVHIHDRDAQEGMLALVPFKEKRGLVFIDPSYEVKTDYRTLPQTILQVHKRFSNALIALWYPILPNAPHQAMLKTLKQANLASIWQHEWIPAHRADNQVMQGSGIFFINPPWKINERLSFFD